MELAPFFRATSTTPCFLTLTPPRGAPPFLACASGEVALKMAQVPIIVSFQSVGTLTNSP